MAGPVDDDLIGSPIVIPQAAVSGASSISDFEMEIREAEANLIALSGDYFVNPDCLETIDEERQ